MYDCECVKCGYKESSEQHCADIKCPKCGGQMRREKRPGTGKGFCGMIQENQNSGGNMVG